MRWLLIFFLATNLFSAEESPASTEMKEQPAESAAEVLDNPEMKEQPAESAAEILDNPEKEESTPENTKEVSDAPEKEEETDEDDEKGDEPEFWSTGPIVAPPGDIVEFGHVAFQPYFNWFQYRGAYDSKWKFQSYPTFNTFLFQPYTRVGIFKTTEFDIVPQLYYNHVDGAGKWLYGDTPVWTSTMLLEADHWYPSIILQLSANLPTGKYQKLKASKLETDLGGTGSWSPGVGLILYKDWHLWNSHFLGMTAYANYAFQTSVHVKGLNAYGGDETTKGKVHPGNQLLTMLSFEFSLSQNWVLALDSQYVHGNRSKFNGETIDPVGNPSFEQVSLAPAIEYIWDENSGVIFGGWFSVAGRNVDQFNSLILAVYLYR